MIQKLRPTRWQRFKWWYDRRTNNIISHEDVMWFIGGVALAVAVVCVWKFLH